LKNVVGLLICLLAMLLVEGTVFAADKYETVKNRGSMICGVKDSTPPFGYVYPKPARLSAMISTFALRSPRNSALKSW
jgi:polar amino acid transport system substrate-binding protein